MGKLFKFLNSIQIITEYIMACIFCVIFALYCSGRVGYFLLTVLILAPVCSIVYTFILSKILTVGVKIPLKVYHKGSNIEALVTLNSPRFIPCPLLKIKLDMGAVIEGERDEICLSKEAFFNKNMELNLTAKLAGGGYIGIENCKLTDFFNIISFKVKRAERKRFLIGILPQLDVTDDLMKKLEVVIKESGEAREIDESPFEKNTMSDGFPGHEHREYTPGDPLKLINYKLSSKREELYVRLLEQQISGKVVIRLNHKAPKHLEEKELPIWWQQEIEQTLGLLYQLLLRQFIVEFHYEENNCTEYIPGEDRSYVLEVLDVSSPDYLETLKQKLAFCVWRDYE